MRPGTPSGAPPDARVSPPSAAAAAAAVVVVVVVGVVVVVVADSQGQRFAHWG